MLIAIAGSTASGKTTLTILLKKIIGNRKTVIISQDNYYRDWSHLSTKERKKINFDDFKSFDWGLLIRHLKSLKNGIAIFSPEHDFVQSRRLKMTKKVEPKQYLIIEGLMPFFNKEMRSLMDYKIYIDTDNAICLARRLKRDTMERGDSIESVCKRYFEDVLPMQNKYVEPQKKWADLIIED